MDSTGGGEGGREGGREGEREGGQRPCLAQEYHIGIMLETKERQQHHSNKLLNHYSITTASLQHTAGRKNICR